MAKKKKNWISKAKLDEGSLTKKADAAGKTIEEFCAGKNLDTKTTRQCNLAKTFRKMHKN